MNGCTGGVGRQMNYMLHECRYTGEHVQMYR